MIVAAVISPILGYFTPTGGFVIALIIMFAFNIWLGWVIYKEKLI
jgi:Sec-independent protein secretion pathway component TatC